MYERHKKGLLAELKVQEYFISNDCEVYMPINDNANYDMIICREGQLYRVSVKYTSQLTKSQKWMVETRNVSRRNDGKVSVKMLDRDSIDLLAVYIAPEDRVVILNSSELTTTYVRIGKHPSGEETLC